MRKYSHVLLLSPITEFHCYTPDAVFTDRLLQALRSTMNWAKDLLEGAWIYAETILETAGIPDDMSAYLLRTLTKDSVWMGTVLSNAEETLKSSDALVLMPDVHKVESPLCDSIRGIAQRLGVPEADAYLAASVDEGDFLRSISLIDDAVLHPRERMKVVMRGGRSR